MLSWPLSSSAPLSWLKALVTSACWNPLREILKLLEIAFGHREGHRDGLDLVDDDDAGATIAGAAAGIGGAAVRGRVADRAAGAHQIAGIDQANADSAIDG